VLLELPCAPGSICWARAVLLQYPALWVAGDWLRAPLHAGVCTAGRTEVLLAGPGGVGKATLVLDELARGGRAASDNLSVSEGVTAWGVAEPLRLNGGRGRRMPHGRREMRFPGRVHHMKPRAVVVTRGEPGGPALEACTVDETTRSLVAGTYVAGELRRYWAFAATMSAGTGAGLVHPGVERTATGLCASLPCIRLRLRGPLDGGC
jgi:hypothetical protein